ncbi:MAG: hypothetical protein JEY91_11685 [Spirochaetaceae bacterium]|nr:hypothetical protein [Spirochaetaceae bacterium]
MRFYLILILCFFTGFFLISCVTTEQVAVQTESVLPAEPDEVRAEPEEKKGIIYSSRVLTEGPLLLGSKEHMTAPVSEFSILYTLYFPLSGIVLTDSAYRETQGTRWKVESDLLVENVYFERALLSEDDEGRSWWYFSVEGDGFEREYEFLVDSDWRLMEMRYLLDGQVKSYAPSVDELNNLSNGSIDYGAFKRGSETVETPAGRYQADHIVLESEEFWMTDRVIGHFVQSLLKEDKSVILEASLIEEKKGYGTIFNSY